MEIAVFVAVITTGGVIAGAIITGVLGNRKLDKNLAVHDIESKARKDTLSGEYTSLSKEIGAKHTILSTKQAEIAQAISAIRETQIVDIAKREAHYSQLDNAQQVLVNSASMMGQFSEEFARLVAENKALRTQVQQLEEENAQLRADFEPGNNSPEFE